MMWFYRPRGWPPWNHDNRRLVRWWSAGAGLDEGVMLEHYWDEGWRRRAARSLGDPEDQLWRAASAVSDMLDALAELAGGDDGGR
jgi:hypothetical protein